MRIRNKLLILYTLITLIPLILISLISFVIFNSSLTEKSQEQLANLLRESSSYLTEFTNSRTADINTLSSSLYVRYYLTSGVSTRLAFENSVYEALQKFVESYSFYSEAMILDPEGNILIDVFNSNSLDRVQKVEAKTLLSIIGSKSSQDVIKLIHSEEKGKGVNLIFSKALRYYSYVEDPNLIPEKLYGYMVLKLPVNNVFKAWEKIRFGKTGLVYFIDSDKRIIAHPNQDFILQTANLVDERNIIKSTFTEDGLIGVVFEEPTSELYQASTRLKYCVGSLLVLASIFATILVYYIAGSFSKPVDAMAHSAGLIAGGNLDCAINYQRKDEFGSLACALNHMRKQLKEHQAVIHREAAHAAIGRSTAMVAHDVRKPLASMKALLTMLPEIKDNSDQLNRMMVSVDRNIEKTNTMLNDILEFSRDSTALELKDHDPQSVITSALSDALRNHPDSDVSIEYDLKHKDYLHVDGERIIRVLTNIIDNALDAMTPSGSDKSVGTLRVGTSEYSSSDPAAWRGSREGKQDGSRRSLNSMRIIISDTGPGIPPDILPKIFDPFFTHGKKGGTGLGLSICQKIIQMHGGKIEAHSFISPSPPPSPPPQDRRAGARGEGVTEFIIELPATEGQLSVNESELIRHSSELKPFHEEEKARVDYGDTANTSEFMRINKERGRLSHLLIVDDEPLFRETVRTLLNSLSQVRDHIRVVEADSAEAALRLFNDRVFDYVVADIDLGKKRMNGYEFTQIVLRKYQNTYVLIHSNKRKEELDIQIREVVNDETRSTNHEARFMGFLPKPMRSSELLQFLACKSFEAPSPSPLPGGERVKDEGRFKKVLLVNDDESINLSMKLSLKSDNVQVLDATNVSDALKHLAASNVDIVLADINLGENMPDGYDLLKKIKEQGKNVPFYFMSGYSKADQWPKAQDLGANGYLQLPIDTDEIKRILGI